jgi:hypothetical protein
VTRNGVRNPTYSMTGTLQRTRDCRFRPIRELPDLTRQRTPLTRERATAVNRQQKVLENANIKLASVATDICGVSAEQMLKALIAGETDIVKMAELAQGRPGLTAKKLFVCYAKSGVLR